jgi:hypothetical protein
MPASSIAGKISFDTEWGKRRFIKRFAGKNNEIGINM